MSLSYNNIDEKSPRIRRIIPCAIIASGILSSLLLSWGYIVIIIWIALILVLFNRRLRRHGVVAIFQIGIPLLSSTVALILYYKIHSNFGFSEEIRKLADDAIQISAFFQVVATLYAICIAFTLWKAMSDHDLLKSTLRDEASKIKSSISFLDYFDNVEDTETRESLKEIRCLLKRYVENFTGNSDIGHDHSNSKRLSRCVELVENLHSPEDNDKVALDGFIKSISDLIMIRSKRMSLMENRISPYLLLILGLISVVSTSFFFVFDSRQINAAHFIIPCLTFMYVFLLVLLIDIDSPFIGYWNVKVVAFSEVMYELNEDPKFSPTSMEIGNDVVDPAGANVG